MERDYKRTLSCYRRLAGCVKAAAHSPATVALYSGALVSVHPPTHPARLLTCQAAPHSWASTEVSGRLRPADSTGEDGIQRAQPLLPEADTLAGAIVEEPAPTSPRWRPAHSAQTQYSYFPSCLCDAHDLFGQSEGSRRTSGLGQSERAETQ